MRALTYDGKTAVVSDVPKPELALDSALVRVTIAGVCNTDIELVKGYMAFRGTLGHEFVGIVEEGPEEWRGERVVGEINFACQSCPICYEGLQRHCPSRRVMGIVDADGSFAEYVNVPIANLHTVPASVSDNVAVFAEPLAAAYEVLEQVHVMPNQECLVLGDGKLGLLVAQVLRQAGAQVLVVGHHEKNLDILTQRDIRTVRERDWNPSLYSLVVDATGSVGGLQKALAVTRPRGTVVLKSTTATKARLDLSTLVVNEIRVVGSRCGPFPPALRALETGSIDVASLISHRTSLANCDEALRRAGDRGQLKVLVDMQ
ncbi:MAG: alcohol dehydrogenase catalytic domain-containing protein [Myxococcales bacterium]|nr:alcohol dehydrogenase catalytic domain-containing protein [Myxococcales bacterium]